MPGVLNVRVTVHADDEGDAGIVYEPSFAGSLFGMAMMATRRGSLESMLPFGCFLAVGAGVAATVGPSLIQWYLTLW